MTTLELLNGKTYKVLETVDEITDLIGGGFFSFPLTLIEDNAIVEQKMIVFVSAIACYY